MRFNSIPLDIRTPGQFVELDVSRATSGLPLKAMRMLVAGQKLAGGSAAAGQLDRVLSAGQAVELYGRGSMLARMFAALKAENDTTEVWGLPLADDAAGVVAEGTVTITGPATGAGTLALYVGGQKVEVAVAAADTANAIAAALNAAVNAADDLPVTSAVAANVLTLSCQWKGETGNDIDLRVNYYDGEALPAGIAVAFAAMAAGATNPDATEIFTAIGDEVFDVIVLPWTDAANLTAVEAELADRWGPMRMVEGMAFACLRGAHGALTAIGAARNSAFDFLLGGKNWPQPTYEIAASMAGVVAKYGEIDPARPVQTLPLLWVMPPAPADRFTRAERDLLLKDGISTFTVDPGGRVLLERVISTYQTDQFGLEDTTWLDVNTPLTLSYLRWSLRQRIASKFPRHKLADDAADYGPGQAIVTPSIIKGEIVALAGEWVEAGLIEDLAQFKRDLIVERDASDKNRINALVPPNIVNQFRVFAAAVQFRV